LNQDQWSSLTWFLIGVAICLVSIPYKLGTLSSPGTGFMPFLSGGAISLFAAAGFIYTTIRKSRGEGWSPLFQGVKWPRALTGLLCLCAYALLFLPLGFLICTTLFIAFLLRAILPLRWSLVIGVALITAIASYLIFEVWLKAQLPKGVLGI
jgi:putative tricarboxylic transport membrane protein